MISVKEMLNEKAEVVQTLDIDFMVVLYYFFSFICSVENLNIEMKNNKKDLNCYFFVGNLISQSSVINSISYFVFFLMYIQRIIMFRMEIMYKKCI